jgi:hypothetical protein
MKQSKQSKTKGKKTSSGTILTKMVPLQSGASETRSTTEKTAIDTGDVFATTMMMDDTISRRAPTTAITKAIAGTPPDTTITNKTTTGNTASAAPIRREAQQLPQ